VTDAPHLGGAERYIVAMARAARRRGLEPHVHWVRPAGGPADLFGPAAAGDLHVTMAAPEQTGTLVGFIREFHGMLRDERPDALVINACGRPRFWLTCWLARQVGLPTVWVHQMVDGRDHRRARPKWFDGRVEGLQCWRVPQTLRHRLAGSAATAVVTLNAQDREGVARWQGLARDKIHVIPHGVDCDSYRFNAAARAALRQAWGLAGEPGPQELVIGTAGRLVAGKGMDLLIEATALLRRREIPALAVIAGCGPEKDRLAELSRVRGIADAVRFLDFVEDMPAFYSALDAFALCSETESFGLVLAEAMACTRPVVATPTAGAMRQIVHGSNGWQLGGFSAGELADALASLYRDPAARRGLGEQGRKSVIRQFSIDLTLERTLRALRGPGRRGCELHWPDVPQAPYVHLAGEDAG